MTLCLQRLGSGRRLGALMAAAALGLSLGAVPASGVGAAEPGPAAEKQDWTFAGPFGYYDRDQLRRGFKVYQQICSACHGMNLLHYRNLSDPGGPELPAEEVEAIAAEKMVTDGPDDQGEMFERPATPNDRFVNPYRNEKEAALINNGVVPPDMSVIAKARKAEGHIPWYMSAVAIAQDIATMYEEQGPDYIYALLTGYEDPPEGRDLTPGASWNRIYPGNQIAMAQPLYDDMVEYTDGTPTTVEQYSRDVTAFLMWSAEPKLEERKRMGAKVMLYLLILATLLYLSKRLLWKQIKH